MIFLFIFFSITVFCKGYRKWSQRAHPTGKKMDIGNFSMVISIILTYQICGDMDPYNQNNRGIPDFTVGLLCTHFSASA